jgi:hypothetical protein
LGYKKLILHRKDAKIAKKRRKEERKKRKAFKSNTAKLAIKDSDFSPRTTRNTRTKD